MAVKNWNEVELKLDEKVIEGIVSIDYDEFKQNHSWEEFCKTFNI